MARSMKVSCTLFTHVVGTLHEREENQNSLPKKTRDERAREKRLDAFSAFNARKFPADCFDNLRYCCTFMDEPTFKAKWNKKSFASFRTVRCADPPH